MSSQPFVLDTPSGAVFVTPVCGAWMVRRTSIALTHSAPAGLEGRRRNFPRALAAPMRISPEGARIEDLKALTRRLVRDGAPVLTFSLHSTSLTAGAAPYAADEGGVARLLALSEEFFAFFRDELGGEFIALDELAALYGLTKRERARLHA